MKGLLNNLFSMERKIASDFLTTPVVHSHARIRFCSARDKNMAVEYLAEALKKALNTTEYQKLPWFGQYSQKTVAQKISTEFFRCRLKSNYFPLRYDCYYIDEISNINEYCDCFYIRVNPDLDYDSAIQKLAEFIAASLKEYFPTLSKSPVRSSKFLLSSFQRI